VRQIFLILIIYYFSIYKYSIDTHTPISYKKTPNKSHTGFYHSGDLSDLFFIDQKYFVWETDIRGFSIDFYFPDHRKLQCVDVVIQFDESYSKGRIMKKIIPWVKVEIYWKGSGSTTRKVSGELHYDCYGQKIDKIRISYETINYLPSTYIKFNRITISEIL
jgi:hypothetical protein